MSATISTVEPTAAFAGDTLKWNKTFSDYPASEGWQLSYKLRGAITYALSFGSEILANGSDFNVVVPAATTGAWNPDNYWLFGFVSKGAERYQIYNAQLLINPNQATLTTAYDGRTIAQKVLDTLDVMLLSNAAREEMEIDISVDLVTQRKIRFAPRPELLQMRAYWSRIRQAEIQKENIANGKSAGNKILTRFTTPR